MGDIIRLKETLERIERQKIRILEARLSGLSVEEQRVYIRGRLDEMGFYFPELAGYDRTMDRADLTPEENEDYLFHMKQANRAGMELLSEPLVAEYILGKLDELDMNDEASRIEEELQREREHDQELAALHALIERAEE